MEAKTLIVTPTYNERENILVLLSSLRAVAPCADVLVIDDASPDGTGDAVDEVARRDPQVHIIHRTGKLGYGTAHREGFGYALQHGYDRSVLMDADLSHRPEDLPLLLRAAERADVVVGSRRVRGGKSTSRSRWRNLLSAGGAAYARFVLRLPVRDATSGFNCLNRAALTVLAAAPLRATGYSFLVEIKYRCARAGLAFTEVPITFEDRKRGQSKMSQRIFWEAAVMVLRMRFERPGQGAS